MRELEWNEPIPYEEMPTNPRIAVYDFSPMNDFTKKFLHLYRKAEAWAEYSLFSVIIKLKNDYTYYYNNSENKLIQIKMFDDISELTEEEWRNGFTYLLERKIGLSGMSKYDVANGAGISSQQLSRYIHRKVLPSIYIVHRLSEALDCDINDILPHDFVPIE